MENGTREDAPTGSTPRKRAWEYDDEWELTGTREAVLRDWAMRKQLEEQHKRDQEIRKRFTSSVSEGKQEGTAGSVAPAGDPSDPEVEEEAEAEDVAPGHEDPASEAAEEPVEPAPAPYLPIPPPAKTVRSSRQSKMPAPPARPPSKIGIAARPSNAKVAPLAEKGNTTSRNKRVK